MAVDVFLRVARHISAMLWKGVIGTPRFIR
jgi:hypothetical protein